MSLMSFNLSKVLLKMLELRSVRTSELSPSQIDEGYLSYLQSQRIVDLSQGELHVVDPIRLAIEAIKLGTDVEIVSQRLDWRDFEKLCVEALRSHDFNVKAPFRFKANGKRREIDVVAHKRDVVLCVDCKHWRMRRGQQYKIKESASNHLDKCMKFAELATSLKGVELGIHGGSHLIPVIVTLIDLNLKHPVNSVWILPIFKLNSFLLDLETHIDELSSIKIRWTKLVRKHLRF